MFYKFRREQLLPEFPIYIGGLSSKMTDIYDRRSHMTRRQLPRLQLMKEVAPFVLNGQTIRDAPGPRRSRLRALQRNDDAKNSLQHFCAAACRESAALDFFCWLRRSRIASRSSARCTAKAAKWRSIPTSRRSVCAATSSNFNSAHTQRASRSSLMRKRLSPKKILLVHGDPPAVEWMRATLIDELSEVGSDRADAGRGD